MDFQSDSPSKDCVQKHSSPQKLFPVERTPNASFAAIYPVVANPDSPAGPNNEVHAAFIYYLAQKGDKTLKAQCVRCGLVRVKSFPRQKKHLLECPKSVAMEPASTSASPQREMISASVSVLPQTMPTIAPSQNYNSEILDLNNLNRGSSTRGDFEATLPNAPVQLQRPVTPSSPNHMLSAFHRQPESVDGFLPVQAAPTHTSAIQQYSWLSRHTPKSANTFRQISQETQLIKIEFDSDQPISYSQPKTAIDPRSSSHEAPLASVEVDEECDDSPAEESSENDDSRSESDAESEDGSDEGADGNAMNNIFPFDDDDEDMVEHGNDTSLPISKAPTSHTEGRFGPSAVHKRPRQGERKRGFPKGQKRGPKKPVDPGPEFTALQNEAMRVFIEEQDNQKALRLIQYAISTNPEIYSAHALLSEILFAEGEDQKAVDALYLGAHSAPRDADIWQGVADACLRLTTLDREIALRMALHCYKCIIDIDENNHDALFQRAAIYHEMSNYARALLEYENLLKIMPHNTSILRQKARLLVDMGRTEEAISICETCITHGKGSGEGLEDEFSWPDVIVYTDIFARRGHVDEAIAKLKKLSRWLVDREIEDYWDDVVEDDREWDAENEPRRVEIDGFHPHLFPLEVYGQALPLEARVRLGLYRLTQGLDSRLEACGHFEWLEPDNLDPGAPIYGHKELFLEVAKALKDIKEHREAIRFYDALVAVDAYGNESFWLQVAATSFICGRKEQSRQCYEKANAANPGCVEARLQLAMLYVDLGNKAKALQNAEEAVELTTGDIKKTDRRQYEKKHRKIARKAAERVLKIARRMGRPRNRHSRVPPGPAAIKRQREAQSRKEKKLAAKIEKQRKIYERKAGQSTATKQSDEQRTSKIQKLYANLNEAMPAMRSDDPEGQSNWTDSAQQMIADFCSTTTFFPHDRHMRFEGYDVEALKKSHSRLYEKHLSSSPSTSNREQQSVGVTALQSNVPTEYRGIQFTAWLDIFLETALLHAKSGQQWKETCYALLKSAHDCNVWYHDPDALLQIYTCYFACALELHDEHTLLFTVGRWFIKQYQFCTDAYRLFAALNLLYTLPEGGKPPAAQSEFRSSTTQKFIMRKINQLDSLLPDDYNVDGEEGPVPSFMRNLRRDQAEDDENVSGSDLRPKEMDVVLLCLYGHILYAGDTFVSALSYFYRALTLDPKNTMALLSIALCYIHEVGKRGTEDRHMHVLNGMAVFEEYAEARTEDAIGKGDDVEHAARKEVEYNRARIWQMLGMSDLALNGYDEALSMAPPDKAAEESKEWSMEAAFAAANIYASNGDPSMARHITEKWLVVE